jgi:hypothetical protein
VAIVVHPRKGDGDILPTRDTEERKFKVQSEKIKNTDKVIAA